MLDVCLLGTGGMMPLPYRWLTSLMMRYNGSTMMIDCGEGTQIAVREKGWSVNPVDVICFTHYHGDHIGGLPGLLLTMGNAERREPLTLIGPAGLEKVVGALRVIAPELPFPIIYQEIRDPEQDFSVKGWNIHAFRVNHRVTCYGYSITIPRAGRFQPDRARALGLPLPAWGRLQHGQTVEIDGKIYTPDMVMGADRKGLKVTYATDTRPTSLIVKNAAAADLCILEGMYGDDALLPKAREKKHMTFSEAATIAQTADPRPAELWLTHFSPSMNRPEEYLEQTRKIFAGTIVPKDGRTKVLNFDDE